MASFSYQQHHPILVHDSDLSLDQYPQIQINEGNNILNNSIPAQFYNLQVADSVHAAPGMVMNNSSKNENNKSENDMSFFTKTCCTTMSSDENDEPYCSSVTKKHSTDESGEQVTQKVEKKRKVAAGHNSAQSKDARENKSRGGGGSKKQKSGNNNKGSEKKLLNGKKNEEGKKGQEEPPTGFIHVRARRGQATDSHSLAERVRREKISERMKMLQRLVPGCEKVTGKALMLDEIINYVQSLQNQVEFLSMKLSSLNPMFYDFGMDIENSFVVRPEGLNNLASQIQSVPQCSQSQPTDDNNINDNNNNYQTALMEASSASLLLQQSQRTNGFFHENVSLLWDIEEQRQSLFHLNQSFGFNNFQSI